MKFYIHKLIVFLIGVTPFKGSLFKIFDEIRTIDFTDMHQGLAPSGLKNGEGFKDYFITQNMPEKLSQLRSGLDKGSLQIIDQKLEHLLNFPAHRTVYAKNIRCLDRNAVLYNKDQLEEQSDFERNLPRIKKELILKTYIPEVVYYHHGLKLLSESLKDYIRNSTIIDCGADYGDSATIFGKYYNPSKVVSFELTARPSDAEKAYYETIDRNNLDKDKFIFVTKGLGINSLRLEIEGRRLDLTTIDESLKDYRDIRLIKMDIEGAAYDAIGGGVDIIKSNRPILIISIYHSPKEFFETKRFVEDLMHGYKFFIRNLNFVTGYELETVLICCPEEVLPNADFVPNSTLQ